MNSNRCRPFSRQRRGIDVAGAIEGERGDLFLGRAVEDETFARGRNAVDESAAVGAGNQIALRIEGEDANVGFVALEKYRVLAVGRDAKNLAMVAGSNVEVARLIQSEIPDIFCAGLEIDG